MKLKQSRRASGRRALGALCIVVAASLALAGCQSAVKQASVGASAAPQHGGTLVVVQNADAQPSAVFGLRAGNNTWVSDVFETLTKIDPKTGQPEPDVAKSWSTSANGLSMDIQLRHDVTFQTGRKMTAEDVKFSLQQAALPANAAQTDFIGQQITAIKVTGTYSLQLTFAKPLSNIFDFFEQAVIVDKDTFSGLASGKEVVGTGPYKFVNWQPGAQITLERYNGYRDAAHTYYSKIEFEVTTNNTAELNAIRSGRAQIAVGLDNSDALTFKGKQYTLTNAGGTIYPLGLNVTSAPLNNVKVRQAIAYAIDRKRINSQVFANEGTVTDLAWSPNEPGYPTSLTDYYTYDPAKAKKLVEEAGATGATIPIVVPDIPTMETIFQIVQNNLKAIGLNATANVLDVTVFDARQTEGDLGPAFLLLHGQVGFNSSTLVDSDPDFFAQNPSHFSSPEYSQLTTALINAKSASAHATALRKLSLYILQQAFTLTMVQAPGVVVSSDAVHGITISKLGYLDLANAYVTK